MLMSLFEKGREGSEAHELVSQKQNSFETELAIAKVEEVLKRGT